MAKRQIELEIDISDRSSEVGCGVCLSVIQSATNHRQCGKCGMTICTGCIDMLQKKQCPTCKCDANFVANAFIARHVYPKLTTRCSYLKCGREVIDLDRHLDECMYRPLNCTFCNIPIDTASIHEHYAVCRPWRTALPSRLTQAIRDVAGTGSAESDDSKGDAFVGRSIPLMCVRGPGKATEAKMEPPDERARIMYIWRAGASINMHCIQLTTSSISVGMLLSNSADMNSSLCMSIPVCDAEHLHKTAPTSLTIERLREYDTYAFKPESVCLLIINKDYIVRDEHGIWARATLIESQRDDARTLTFITQHGELINIPGNKALTHTRPLTAENLQMMRESHQTMMMVADMAPIGSLMAMMRDAGAM